jgi:prepilin-type N-terminal cleavage/methylation domain-containing protein
MITQKKGMTLTEVLIVVVILGVLGTLVLPRFFGQQERGAVAEAIGILSAIRQGEEGRNLEVGYLDLDTASSPSTDWHGIGIDQPPTANFRYTVVSGTATAIRTNPCGNQCCPGRTITLAPDGLFGGTHPFGPNPDAGATCS